MTFSCYFEQTEPLFKELEILSFKKLVIQRILLMMFKYSLGIVPKPITLLFTRNDEVHPHNTRRSSQGRQSRGVGGSQPPLIFRKICVEIIKIRLFCVKFLKVGLF